jgi:zinc transport system permease protein
MTDFVNLFFSPEMAFFKYAFLTAIVAAVAFGIIGTFVVVKQISSIAGAISHCVLGGIGAALYAQTALGWKWCLPVYGAVVAALLAAIIIGLVSMYAKQREDTVIGAVWAIGMATGLMFIAKTPGYVSLESYLFGNILLVSADDFWITLGLDIFIISIVIIFFNNFLAVCFDSKFAEIRGMKVKFFYLLLLCLTALTIVLLVNIVGIIMVIALLTLPAAIAGQFTKRLWSMMVLAVLLSLLFSTVGMGVSYSYNLPSGPTIVLLAGSCYILLITKKLFLKRQKTVKQSTKIISNDQ